MRGYAKPGLIQIMKPLPPGYRSTFTCKMVSILLFNGTSKHNEFHLKFLNFASQLLFCM